MKKVVGLVVFLLLAVSVSAQEFPGPFIVNGAPANNLAIVVGDNAPSGHSLAAVDVASALKAPSNAVKLAGEISDITQYNSVLIGSPNDNQHIANLLGISGLLSGIKLIKHANGNVALLIMGSTPDEVRMNVNFWISGSAPLPAGGFRIRMGERLTVLAHSVEYDVLFSGLSDEYAKFVVNGEVVALIPGTATRLADGSFFKVISVIDYVATVYMEGITAAKPVVLPPPAMPEERVEKYPVPPPVPVQEYESCIEQLKALKETINKYDKTGMEVPVELWNEYKALDARCQGVRPEIPPVAPIVREERCIGCVRETSCLQFGIRLVDEKNQPVYCDIDSMLKPQKQLGESCQNNYECLTNTCTGRCISIEERITAVEQELKEQRSLLQKILDFFKNIFGG